MRKGAKLIQKAAIAAAPEEDGDLKKGIRVRAIPKKETGPNEHGVRIGLLPTVYYGLFQEFGWRPGKRVERGGTGQGPKIKGKRFLSNAYDEHSGSAMRVAQAEMRRLIELEAKKLR